ncbi:hypothetical protein CHM34_06440 [Paludifilum halophilum]|uniref:Uncharacterized protein n=2 Tax=Paludifilum halophilum TaxID=1642702 RepID=A0A235B821_9BACL|nr:hypothetical protein CHM34_06440 [Paludifilum halophilum]
MNSNPQTGEPQTTKKTDMVQTKEKPIFFPEKEYPERAQFFQTAFVKTKIESCTLDRKGMETRKKKALQGTPPKKGFDRVQWPMAICKEGGKGAYVKYITSSKNLAAEEWIQNELKKYPDGTSLFLSIGKPPKLKEINRTIENENRMEEEKTEK